MLAPTVVRVHPASASNFAHLFSVLHTGLISREIGRAVSLAGQAFARARTATTRAPEVCRTRTDSAAVAPVVTMSSTTSTSPVSRSRAPQSRTRPATFRCRAALDSPTESRTSAFIRSAGTTPRVATARCGRERHPGDGVAAAPAGGVAAGGRRDDGQRRAEHAPRQQLPQPTSQRGAERADQVGAAVLLDRHDRVAAGARVPAEREDGHAGVTRGVMRCGSSVRTRSSPRAGVAPPGRRRAAAAALQRKNQVEHVASVAAGGDIPTACASVTSAATRSCAPIPTNLAMVMSSSDVRPAVRPEITSPNSPATLARSNTGLHGSPGERHRWPRRSRARPRRPGPVAAPSRRARFCSGRRRRPR